MATRTDHAARYQGQRHSPLSSHASSRAASPEGVSLFSSLPDPFQGSSSQPAALPQPSAPLGPYPLALEEGSEDPQADDRAWCWSPPRFSLPITGFAELTSIDPWGSLLADPMDPSHATVYNTAALWFHPPTSSEDVPIHKPTAPPVEIVSPEVARMDVAPPPPSVPDRPPENMLVDAHPGRHLLDRFGDHVQVVEFDSKEEDVNVLRFLNAELDKASALDGCVVVATDASIAMSTFSLLSGVPSLVGEKNWVRWSELMENILSMMTLPGMIYTAWDIADDIVAIPQLIVDMPAVAVQAATALLLAVTTQPATYTAASVKAQNNWQSLDCMAYGMINNRLSGHLLHHNQVSFHIDSNVEPSLQLALLENAYSHLERSQPPINIPGFVCVMNLLNAVPREWSYVISTYLQTHPIATIDYASVQSAILTQWQHLHQVKAHEVNMSHAGMSPSGNQQPSGSSRGDQKKKPHKHGKGSKGQQANSADAEIVSLAVAAAAPDNTYVTSSTFAIASLAIISNPKVSGLSTWQKINDARASQATESAILPCPLAECLSTPVGESLVKRLKFKKMHYQTAGQKALELWDERLGAMTSVPSVATRGSSPLFSAPSSPHPAAVSLPPPQSPLNMLPPLTSAPDANMISLGDDASDYGDNTYVPNYGLNDGTIQGQAAEVEHLCSLGQTQEPTCQCCPFRCHMEFDTLMDRM
ncbi:hypothetical protein AN958_08395 [Leucoagaricus sp. SymC.cos]|nr:hypothetical protein AN958_08395 [Leucoagaricus sp. SymC.cos]